MSKISKKPNIRTQIDSIKTDKRASKQVSQVAKKLEKYVGNDSDVPKSLSEEIKKIKSTSEIASTMKNYVRNKK